ncbi:MAG: pimeloyl-ACP methyl ester esterase BioH [Methylococcaceae bacterium]|nr:pimeloyl-ACP methyl ester esterase BioH [Methylococcaceae bacterium]
MKTIHQETLGVGKPIILVHGWGMHTGIWRAFAHQLAASYCVTCIDLPGHGKSEKLDDFTLETISATLVDAVPDQPYCWLGWSLGASVVLEIARRYPERCSALILLAGNPHFVQTDHWPGVRLNALNAFADSLRADAEMTLTRFLSLQINGLPGFKTTSKILKSAVTECDAPDTATLNQGLSILKETDLRQVLAQLTLPVLAILGDGDTLVPPAVGHEMQKLLPTLDLNILDQAGHVPFLSHPEQVINIIAGFMDKQ